MALPPSGNGRPPVSSLQAALRRMNMGAFRRFVVTGRDGKLVLADGGKVLLVVLLAPDANMGLVTVEMREAVQDVQRKLGKA